MHTDLARQNDDFLNVNKVGSDVKHLWQNASLFFHILQKMNYVLYVGAIFSTILACAASETI